MTKSRIRIIYELYHWLFRERTFNEMYYAFGLNLKGTNLKDFIGKREFLQIKDTAEKGLKTIYGGNEFDHRILTKDKFYATSIMRGNGIPCIGNSGMLVVGKIIKGGSLIYPLEEILKSKGTFVLKNTLLEAGKGVYFGEVSGNNIILNNREHSLVQFGSFISRSKWIIQDVCKPIREIQAVNGSALNITRIVTVNNGVEILYISGFQSFATNNQKTDGWDKETIYVGIDISDSCLKKDGFYHPSIKKPGIVREHPDTGVTFENYKIRFLPEAVDLCIKTHYLFLHLFCIGWDVVLTEDGPKILEINEVPGLNAIQCISGGLRGSLLKYSRNILQGTAKNRK